MWCGGIVNGADGDEEKQNWLVNIRQTNQCHRVTGVGGLTVGLGDGYFASKFVDPGAKRAGLTS